MSRQSIISFQLLLTCTVWALSGLVWADANDRAIDRAREVLKSAPIVDGHNDLPWVIRDMYRVPSHPWMR